VRTGALLFLLVFLRGVAEKAMFFGWFFGGETWCYAWLIWSLNSH
jgi:hypothetical protein